MRTLFCLLAKQPKLLDPTIIFGCGDSSCTALVGERRELGLLLGGLLVGHLGHGRFERLGEIGVFFGRRRTGPVGRERLVVAAGGAAAHEQKRCKARSDGYGDMTAGGTHDGTNAQKSNRLPVL